MTRKSGSLLPEHEDLRRAVQWLIEQPLRDAQTIEEAARRFDLSPVDEEFLLHHFRSADAERSRGSAGTGPPPQGPLAAAAEGGGFFGRKQLRCD